MDIIKDLEGEVWRTVSWAPDYEVSSKGRVKSLKREQEILIKGSKNHQGYPQVGLRHDGTYTTRTIHRLMSEAFLNHHPDGKYGIVVNHIDGIVDHNDLDNFEIITQRKNCSVGRVCTESNTGEYNILMQPNGRYGCRMYINGRRVNLGHFDLKEDAISRRDEFLRHIEIGDEEAWLKTLIANPNKTSQIDGICHAKSNDKWQVKYFYNKKYYYFGYHDTEAEAVDALNIAKEMSMGRDFDMWYYTEYIYKDRYCGIAGVSYAPKKGKYRANANHRDKFKSLGFHINQSDATLAVVNFWNSKKEEVIEDYLKSKNPPVNIN